MLGYLILAGFLLCGVCVSMSLFYEKSLLIRLWIGLCAGLILMMWLPAGYAFFMDFTVGAQLAGLATAVCIGSACALWARRRLGRQAVTAVQASTPFAGDMPVLLLILLVVPILVLSVYLQYTHTLRNVDGALHVGQSTYGDLCLHLGIATGLQNASFPPEYTILPGTLLGYPFLSDSMVTTMLLFGSDLATSFVVTGSLMMLLVYTGFVIFAWELTKSRAAVVLAFLFMFLNGGLGYLYTFDGVFQDSTALREVFTGYYKTPTNQPDLNLRWVNVICDMMVPQRTLLAGWCVLLPALYMLTDALRSMRRRDYVLLGLWAGLMPMIHTHSFLALGLASAGVCVHRIIFAPAGGRKSTIACFALYAACACALAAPQLLTWTFPQTVGGGSLGFRFNWVNNRGDGTLIDGYFWFWIKNVGLNYILLVPAALFAGRKSRERALAIGALVIYTVAELIQFQPNEYDNNKLFYVAYMLMMPVLGAYMVRLWKRLRGLRLRGLLACLVIASGTVSGALSIARETISDYQLFSAQEAEAAEFIKAETPEHSVFLTAQQHCNAVAALSGRSIVCGTGSYLYFHGVDYSAQADACRRMFTDPADNQELFDTYDVDYVYISNWERSSYDVDEAWFAEEMDCVFESGDVVIYARREDAGA